MMRRRDDTAEKLPRSRFRPVFIAGIEGDETDMTAPLRGFEKKARIRACLVPGETRGGQKRVVEGVNQKGRHRDEGKGGPATRLSSDN